MSVSIQWHGDALAAKIHAAVNEGAIQACEKIVLPVHQKKVPWATGDLASHDTATATQDGAMVSSSGPYARVQELDETFRHPDPTNPLSLSGRTAHSLRDALQTNESQISDMITKKVNAALR